MAQKTFKAKLSAEGERRAWTILKLPFRVEKVWGTRARMRVRGTINGVAYRSTIFPLRGGKHLMMVSKEMQVGANAEPGDTVKVVMQPDTAPRVVKVPPELKRALAKNKAAKQAFAKMPYPHQKEYVEAIVEAKKPETRARRIAGALKLMVAWGKRR